jgi:hypothetical protein
MRLIRVSAWPIRGPWFMTCQTHDVPQDAAELAPLCSARGCRAPAHWALRWNNPRLHSPDRRKTWLACDEHRGSLGDFLTARGFLRDVEPLG